MLEIHRRNFASKAEADQHYSAICQLLKYQLVRLTANGKLVLVTSVGRISDADWFLAGYDRQGNWLKAIANDKFEVIIPDDRKEARDLYSSFFQDYLTYKLGRPFRSMPHPDDLNEALNELHDEVAAIDKHKERLLTAIKDLNTVKEQVATSRRTLLPPREKFECKK